MTENRPILSVCEGVLRLGDLASDAEQASAAGYTMMEVMVAEVEKAGLEKASRILADAGLKVSAVAGTQAESVGTGSRDLVLRSIEIAAVLGAPIVGFHPGTLGDLTHQEAAEHTREWFSALGPRAAEAGVSLALEPIHPVMRNLAWVHTVRQAAPLVEGIPGACLMVDTGHTYWDPDFVADFQRHLDLIKLVQVTNVDPVALAGMRYERAGLASGDVRVDELIRAFHGAGFRGVYELEARIRMPRQDRQAFIASELAWFNSLF